MPVPDQNDVRDPEPVGDLQERIAELEEECKRLRALNPAGALICRDPAAACHALQEAEMMLDRAERAAGLGACEWHTRTGRCVSASPGIKRLLGMDDKDRLTAKRFADAIHPHDQSRYRELARRHRRAGDPYVITYRLARGDGTMAEVREIGEPMPRLNGSAETWLAWLQDTTDQRERERQLKRSKAQYRDLIVGSIEGISVIRDHKILFANQAIADIFGYEDPEQLCALETIEVLIPPHEQERIRGYRSARIRGEHAPSRYVSQFVRKDGTLIWVESLARKVDWDDGPAIQTTLVDITERVEAEAALQASEQRFKDFAEASSDWFWETGPDHRFVWYHGFRQNGSGAPDLLGKTRREVGCLDTDDEKWRKHHADLEARRPFRDFRYMRQDEHGKPIYASSSGIPKLAADGTFLGYRGVSTDVTAQVLAEQEVARATGLLADAVDSIKDGLIIYDRDDRIVLVNDCGTAAAAQLGDVLKPGTSWRELVQAQLDRGILKVPDDQREGWFRELAEARRHGSIRCHQTADGRWFELRDHRTSSGGCVTIRADVTAFKETEQALRESEQRFKDFAETSSDWFWESGPDHRFTWFTNTASGIDYAFHDLMGITRVEAAGASPDEPYWQDHQADLDAHRPFHDFRYLRRVPDGIDIFVSINGVPVFDANGSFLGYRGTGKNITAEVQASQRVERSQNMLTDAIEAVADGFLIYDRDDRLVVANENCIKAMPQVADLLQPGKTWKELVGGQLERGVVSLPAGEHATWLRAQGKIHRRGGVRHYQSGDGRWLELRDHRTRDGGCVTIRADITDLRQTQEALKASEQRFRDFAESSSDWFWEMGPDLRFTWFSHEMLKGTHIRASDLIGKSRREASRLDVGDPEKWCAHLADLEAHRSFKDFRYQAPSELGHKVYVSVSGVPMHDESGAFLGYRGMATDISAQVLAEQAMAKARAMLSVATESLRGGLAMFDRDDRLVLCNDGYREHLAPIEAVLGPDFTWQAMIRSLVEHGLIKPPADGLEAYVRQQGALQHKEPCLRQVETGDGRFMEIRSYPAEHGGFAVVRTDVTELRRAQEALKASEQRFRDFAQSSSDWFWEMGPDLRFTWFSVESQVLGKTRPEASRPDSNSEHWRDHLADLEARRPFKNFRYCLASDHGEEIHVSVSGVPIYGPDGAFLGYRGSTADVTAQVLAEQEIARARVMLDGAVESITDGFAMFDKDDRLVLANEGYRKRYAPVLDARSSDITWSGLVRALIDRGLIKAPADDLDAWFKQQSETHHTVPCVRQHETVDGRFIEIRNYPTRDGGFASVRHDVTALKRAQEAVAASERRFRDFAESSSDWFWELGADLRFTWFSSPFLKGTGTDARTAIGKTPAEVVATDIDAQHWRDHAADLEARRPFKDFRYRKLGSDGAEFYVSASGMPIFASDGAFLGYRGTAASITAQVHAEQEVAKARALLADAVESITEGFAIFDAEDRLMLANEGYRDRLAPIADRLGDPFTWPDMIRLLFESGVLKAPSDDIPRWIREQTAAHHGQPCARQLETGDGRIVEIRTYPTREGGFASVKRDITALKRAEERLRQSEQRFKSFAEASSDWFWEMGRDLRFTWFSTDSPGGTGVAAGDLIGQTRMLRAGSGADESKRAAHLADLEARRPFKDFRYHVVGADGGASYLSVSGVPIFDAGGTFLGYRGTGKNVTAEVVAEERAALAQTMLSDAIESIRGGFALYDRDDRLVLCNDSFRTTLAGISDLLRPGTAWETGFRALVDRGLIKDAGEDREAWLRQQIAMHGKAGCQRLLESSAGQWSDVREYPTRHGGLAIVRTDVTELKLAETALRESETLLKHAAQIADLGHWVWDMRSNQCLHCSDGLARMYGTTPEAYRAHHGSRRSGDTVLPEDKERYDEVIARATRLRKGYDIEFRERLADGMIRHMRERGEPVLDATGTLVRMVGILQDITKHKRAEEALQRAHHELEMRVEERTEALRTANQALRREIVEHERTEDALRESRVLLEAIVETAAMGINVKDPSLRYLFMNAYQADVYGVSPEQAVGKTPAELIGHDYGAYIDALDLRVLQSGQPLPYFEEEIRDKDGALRTWLTTKMPVGVGHNVLRYIVTTSLDITELKARERDLKQAQKMDAVGKLTGGIAHDFNNLLFVIRGNVALLKDEIRDSSGARECLGAIQDAAKLGADLTRSLLAFSRQQPLEPAVVNLPEVIDRTVATLLRPFEKSIEIQISHARKVWPVLVDRHQMENALLNLALNARDAMPNGGTLRIVATNHRAPKASYRHGQGLPPGEYVRLVVADSGVGMLPEVIDQAFEPFFTTKAAGAGTGLGLSMVYGFIKQSGGYIDIESKLGQGTTITMHLPRTSGIEKKLEKAPDDRRWLAKGTETILITEDDAAVRRVAVRILTKFGYRTLEANNGPEALEILCGDAAVDLLFADIILSGEMNGAELSREAQILRPDLKVLFASGYSEPAVLRDTEGADRVPLLSKPYDADELGRLIRSLLDDDRPRYKG